MSDTVKFTTYGPNRGLTLNIGAYRFVDGECVVPAQDASAAASILCRYHDVCYAHELEQEIKDYDTAFPHPPVNPPAPPADNGDIKLPPEGSEIVLVPAAKEPAAPEAPKVEAPAGEGEPEKTDAPQGEAANPETPQGEAAAKEPNAAGSDDTKKPNSGKKPNTK